MTAVQVRGLGRRFAGGKNKAPQVDALCDISLDVEHGEIRGLLGPNGAGKTTLCKILSTVLLPTSGSATILGNDVVRQSIAVKRSIGTVFGGDRGLYGRLTARQNLLFWAALYGLGGTLRRRRTAAVLDQMGLADVANERVDRFSRGMKQRLHLARGLIADPPVLLLDEPTVGMDPVAAHAFRLMVQELRSDRRTVLLTTHDMAEAESMCDRVTMVDRGRVLFTEDPRAVGRLISRYEHVESADVPASTLHAVAGLRGVVAVYTTGDGGVRVETAHPEATSAVLGLLVSAGVTDVRTGRPRLEEVYLHLMRDRGMEVLR